MPGAEVMFWPGGIFRACLSDRPEAARFFSGNRINRIAFKVLM
jgi:hypothetical protein